MDRNNRSYDERVDDPGPPITAELVRQFAAAVKAQLRLQAFDVSLYPNRDLHLNLLIVPKGASRNQGRGSAAVEKLTQFADLHGCRIILSPGLQDSHHGTTSKSRLVRFYRKFGFYENKGRRKDFSVSAGMIRDPAPRPTAAPDLEYAADTEETPPAPGL